MRQSRAQAVMWGLAVLAVAAVAGALIARQLRARAPARVFDYSDRSGFPRPVAEMRGRAAKKERASGPLSIETARI